uniref:Uncharacterized protein n=1 Tax=Romanomermis culicivorax TaxID=13658 RepID=A0A915L478_ROMCU
MQIWKEQLAAIKIQHAFRGHTKRQAAARTIQRFMRRTKQGDLDYLVTRNRTSYKHRKLNNEQYEFAAWLSKYALEPVNK